MRIIVTYVNQPPRVLEAEVVEIRDREYEHSLEIFDVGDVFPEQLPLADAVKLEILL